MLESPSPRRVRRCRPHPRAAGFAWPGQPASLPPTPGRAVGDRARSLFQGVIEFSLCLLFAKLVSYTFLFWLPLYITNVGEYLLPEAQGSGSVRGCNLSPLPCRFHRLRKRRRTWCMTHQAAPGVEMGRQTEFGRAHSVAIVMTLVVQRVAASHPSGGGWCRAACSHVQAALGAGSPRGRQHRPRGPRRRGRSSVPEVASWT